jgi:hypothetical protein
MPVDANEKRFTAPTPIHSTRASTHVRNPWLGVIHDFRLPSPSKLSQVMIDMQITPTHPLSVRQLKKNWMRAKLVVRRQSREILNKGMKLQLVGIEF